MTGWYGIDLDGTLAYYSTWDGGSIGAPIPTMVNRVKAWLAEGREVRIFTARVAESGLKNDVGGVDDKKFVKAQRELIQAWCELHIGQKLAVTATKDFGMVCLYDDRRVRVETNTGRLIE